MLYVQGSSQRAFENEVACFEVDGPGMVGEHVVVIDHELRDLLPVHQVVAIVPNHAGEPHSLRDALEVLDDGPLMTTPGSPRPREL